MLRLVALALCVAAATGQQCQGNFIVVGAGMAGLGAAERLTELGVPGAQITVIEARNRVGGRVHTDSASLGTGAKADLGASWIHQGGTVNPIRRLADKYGCVIANDEDKLAARIRSDGTWYSDAQVASETASVWEAVDAVDQNIPLRQALSSFGTSPTGQLYRSRLEFDTAAPDSAFTANGYTNGGGDDIDEGGPEMVFRDGYSTIPMNLSDALVSKGVVLRLQSVVTAVNHNATLCGGASATVRTTDANGVVTTETVSADAIVVTVPLGVLKSGSVTFSPAFPSRVSSALSRMRMGKNGKVFLRFDTAFWQSDVGAGTFGFGIDVKNPTDATRGLGGTWFNLHKYLGVPVLMAFVSGEYAVASEGKTDAQVQADAMAVLRLGWPNAPAPTHFLRTVWGTDPYSKGSYSVWASNAMDDLASLPSVSPTLALAGEHTSAKYPSCVHGAYLSGRTAAELVATGVASFAQRVTRSAILCFLGVFMLYFNF